ncbi:4'-phosphopantetheinyl transferase family protein [Chryseobacterium sp. KLBC 52]|uniref:4'-phosphopantetheinyl transferase family protein n=1 Tax=Chryseobacterium sp. KLBC 52 TaxID=1862702 RepID=UPI000E0C4C8E|nr:4'-phosphopantetheinyl transferase superfamily protein [Chryseobacterium sp. KLBC 52]
MIILYAFIEEENHQYLLDKYLHAFSTDLSTKIQKYRRWQDAQLSLLGRVLLKYGLNGYLDIQDFKLICTQNNKPILTDHNVHFNISHSGSLVVCCISKSVIGIDVEYIDHKINYMDFETQMTENELNRLHTSENTVKEFFTYWTEKEAVVKAHGKGLSIPLTSFEILENRSMIGNESYCVQEVFINDEYSCNVAASGLDIQEKNIHLEHVKLNKL